MLPKSRISKIKIHSDEWFETRGGKLTSSEISCITGSTFLTTGCKTYLYRKAGEILTGKSIRNDLEMDQLRWGDLYEAEAVWKLAKRLGFEYVVCQQLLTEPASHYGCTPDGLFINRESSDENFYDVTNIEVKCPYTYAGYIKLALCKTPQDLKATNNEYYWQVLDQMLNCDCLLGYFAAYHPDFKKGNMNLIEFRKMQKSGIEGGKEIPYPLVRDLKFLTERKEMAVKEIARIIEELTSLGVY